MHIFLWSFGVLLAVVWLGRVLEAAFGMRAIANITLPEFDRALDLEPRITVVVPARNEEQEIERCLRSLLQQEYQNLEIVAVDDRSTDRTGSIMDALAAEFPQSLRVLHVQELPPEWLGKTHAMWRGASESSGEWVLFTDADVIFRPDCLRLAIRYAQDSGADHLVVFPTPTVRSFGERMMMSFLQVSVMLATRPWKVSDPDAWDHVGVGAFNLIKRRAYEAIGAYEALRLEVVDDLWLGKLVKKHRFRQRVALGSGLLRLHWAKGAFGIAHNLTKNIFAVFRFRIWLLLAAVLLVAAFHVAPFVGALLVSGWARLGYVVAVIAIGISYLRTAHRWGISPAFFALHLVSALLMMYAMLRSMILTIAQGGITWRGTKYPLRELRRAAR